MAKNIPSLKREHTFIDTFLDTWDKLLDTFTCENKKPTVTKKYKNVSKEKLVKGEISTNVVCQQILRSKSHEYKSNKKKKDSKSQTENIGSIPNESKLKSVEVSKKSKDEWEIFHGVMPEKEAYKKLGKTLHKMAKKQEKECLQKAIEDLEELNRNFIREQKNNYSPKSFSNPHDNITEPNREPERKVKFDFCMQTKSIMEKCYKCSKETKHFGQQAGQNSQRCNKETQCITECTAADGSTFKHSVRSGTRYCDSFAQYDEDWLKTTSRISLREKAPQYVNYFDQFGDFKENSAMYEGINLDESAMETKARIFQKGFSKYEQRHQNPELLKVYPKNIKRVPSPMSAPGIGTPRSNKMTPRSVSPCANYKCRGGLCQCFNRRFYQPPRTAYMRICTDRY